MRAAFQALAISLAVLSGVVLLGDQSPPSHPGVSLALVLPAAALLATLLLLAAQRAIYRFFGESPSDNKPQSGADQ